MVGCGLLSGCGRPDAPAPVPVRSGGAEPGYVGRGACIECHSAAHEAWSGSDHDLAMQPATPETVLGDFDGATLTHFGVVSRMTARGGRYFVSTQGPDGQTHEYEIKYTFGHFPLQQYLVELRGGRLQALPLCWDSRPAESGGQRWFHIYPDEPVPPGDALHWAGPNHNWNHMCAECHSTDLRKNYDAETDSFATTWSEIDVSCEACHGPASAHVAWAGAAAKGRPYDAGPARGLVVRLGSGDEGSWIFDPGAATARRTTPRVSRAELETCARCHSRRAPLSDTYEHGLPLLDTHTVSLLTDPLYHADGQILEEDYEYGSFLQSRMYHAGVTCTDCHEPHSSRLIASGNALCAKCHAPAEFNAERHHRHPGAAGDPGTNCVDCHMPATTYMVVDERRDHSIRVPRPDLSERLGTPNACNMCHADRSASWSAQAVAQWFGEDRRRPWHFGEAIHAAREGLPEAVELIARLARDASQPAIARATGVAMLGGYPGPEVSGLVSAAAEDPEPLVRLGAAYAAAGLSPGERPGAVASLLRDPHRSVRIEAARALAPAIDDASRAQLRTDFDAAASELVAAERSAADRPESHVNLGMFFTDLGRSAEAEREYLIALDLDPAFTPAALNLADLRRAQGRDADAEEILRGALGHDPHHPAANHALGLTLVRLGRMEEAVARLRDAYEHGAEVPRFGFVLAVALRSTGRTEQALDILRAVHERHPRDRDTLRALIEACRDEGRSVEAEAYEAKLRALEG